MDDRSDTSPANHCTAPTKQNGPLGLFGDIVQGPLEASTSVAEAADYRQSDSEPEVRRFKSRHILQFLNITLIRISLMFQNFPIFREHSTAFEKILVSEKSRSF
jgi:hypothetical protein